jgi:hypothetical protein
VGERALDVVQRWFQSVVTHPGGVDAGLASAEAQALVRLDPGEVESVVRRSRNLTAAERLSIYANAYYARLLECMGACFPTLREALGAETFDDFAFEYLQRYPSRSYTLDRLAESFPRFLDETRPERPAGAEVDWPDFLVDLATLELAIAQVFDGPGGEGKPLLGPDDLLAIPAERFAEARLVPVAGLRLLSFRYPVSAYFGAVRAEGHPPVPEPAVEHVALVRRDFVVRRHPLDPAQHALLASVVAGRSVGEALGAAATLSDLDDDALAAAVRDWFRGWTAAGFFVAVQASL